MERGQIGVNQRIERISPARPCVGSTLTPDAGGVFQGMATGFRCQSAFAWEVTVEGAVRETGRARDIGNCHAVDAVLAKQPSGLTEDGGPVVGHGFSGHPHLFMISIMNRDCKPDNRGWRDVATDRAVAPFHFFSECAEEAVDAETNRVSSRSLRRPDPMSGLRKELRVHRFLRDLSY